MARIEQVAAIEEEECAPTGTAPPRGRVEASSCAGSACPWSSRGDCARVDLTEREVWSWCARSVRGGRRLGRVRAMGDPSYSPEYTEAGRGRPAPPSAARACWSAPRSVHGRRCRLVVAPVKGHRMAKAAIELAVLDAECQAVGPVAGARLGATRTPGGGRRGGRA